MQGAMLPMLMKTNPKKEQEIEIVWRREVQVEMWDVSHPEKEINQVKRENYPVENASKIHTQIFLDVQTLRNTYQENQMDQTAYPRKYPGCA